jgi:glycosyltransferase involved in cell wall biosynthesis
MTRRVLIANLSADLYGASRMMLESADALVGRGWDVVATVPEPGPLVDELIARGCEVHVCPTLVLRKDLLHASGIVRFIGELLRSVPAGLRLLRRARPEVIYVNTLVIPLWLVLARGARVPALCHVHEAESSVPRLLRKTLALPLMLAHRVVANSRFSEAELTRAVPRLAGRCVVVRNGVDGPPTVPATRQALAPPVRLLYIGRISERKGIHDVIQAVAALHGRGLDVRLDVVGSVVPGHERVERDALARASSGGVADRVVFHGFDADIWRHLADADVLIVPSRLPEPFGNTAIEGVLAARPVIASRTGGLVEAVEGLDSTVSVPPGDPTALADAVMAVCDGWSHFSTAAMANAAQAAERFSVHRYGDRIVEIVEQVRAVA